MRLDGLASVPARVRQKDGFPELTRRHKGLRAGAGLKCTFCSVAPQTPFPIPVTLNGSSIPRPFAISDRGFAAFAHGHYLRDEVALRNKHHIFLNGIEIEHADGQPTFIPDGFAVHLHPEIFCPVLPAMNELLGGELMLAFLRHELQRVTGTLEPAEAWWQP